MNQRYDSSTFGRGLLYCAALVVIVAGLRAASSVVVPLLLAIFISVLCVPLVGALQRRLPFGVALAIVLAGLIVVGLAIPLLVGGSVQQMVNRLPEYRQQLLDLETGILDQLAGWGLETSRDGLLKALDPHAGVALFGGFLNSLIRTFGDGLIVFIMVAFMLTEASWFPLKFSIVWVGAPDALDRVHQIVVNIRRYIAIKTGVSLATGVLLGLALAGLGVDYPILFGFMAFLLNYVPTIGSLAAGVPPILLALLQHGLGTALCVSAAYVAVNQAFGSVIEPRLQGRGLGLSPLVVFVSLVFWSWVFGPVGMLLSAPLTMVVKIALEAFPETRWIAVLLGGKPVGSLVEIQKE